MLRTHYLPSEKQHPPLVEKQQPSPSEKQQPLFVEKQHPFVVEKQHASPSEQQHPPSVEKQQPFVVEKQHPPVSEKQQPCSYSGSSVLGRDGFLEAESFPFEHVLAFVFVFAASIGSFAEYPLLMLASLRTLLVLLRGNDSSMGSKRPTGLAVSLRPKLAMRSVVSIVVATLRLSSSISTSLSSSRYGGGGSADMSMVMLRPVDLYYVVVLQGCLYISKFDDVHYDKSTMLSTTEHPSSVLLPFIWLPNS